MPIRAEVFGIERLEEHARAWAERDRLLPAAERGRPLLPRLADNERMLFAAQKRFSQVAQRGQPLSASAEWLLDNFYIVQEQLRLVEQDLSRSYYHELPKVANAHGTGYPRVYGIALELIAHTDSHLDTDIITRFVQGYQAVTPLTLGELWAVAIMLRLGLVENLRRLVAQSLATLQKFEAADVWAKLLLAEPQSARGTVSARLGAKLSTGSAASPDHAPAPYWRGPKDAAGPPHPDGVRESGALAEAGDGVALDPVFGVQLLHLLRDSDPALLPAIQWLEAHLHVENQTVEQVVAAEHLRRAANRVTVGNVVTSMRTLAIVDWPVFVENTSLVEATLRGEAAGVYPRMDFATRDRYRHAVERISKRTRLGHDRAAVEQAVAARAVKLAQAGSTAERARHVGYYLIGGGCLQLEAALGYRPTWRERASRAALAHPTLLYVGLLVLATLGLLLGPLSYAAGAGAAPLLLALGGLLSLIPASAIAVSVVNQIIAVEVETLPLPKLEFQEGVPADCRTMVVVPALISHAEDIQRLCDNLEIRYLANRDPHLHFALLGDFADATEQHRPEDTMLLDAATRQIEELNARYSPDTQRADRFYFFHRQRLWNEGEQVWTGWERKRGKLLEFNRLLRGAAKTSYIVQIGDLSLLSQVKYVISLDADTELPINAARRLVGTIAHPLNRPVLDPATRRVLEGYSIIQPRTAVTALSAGASSFAQIFAGDTGLDPYATTSSDVYQDLFGAGSYVGKAIYDVDAMETVLEGRFPQNLLLSHDLLEGAYARVGLATDIQLLEDFPSGYDAYTRREHRWIRGDWQIIDWLFPAVPDESGARVPNLLPLNERLKIFDNLRRSLLPQSIILLLAGGWTLLPGSAEVWTFFALCPFVIPQLLTFISEIGVHPRGETWRAYLAVLTDTARLNLTRAFLYITFILYQAALSVDAIARVIVRRAITHRHLLKWSSAATVELRQARTPVDYVRRMLPSPLLATGFGLLLAWAAPGALGAALPLLALWWIAPFLAYGVSRPLQARAAPLPSEAYRALRLSARKIWRFYETFAGADDHYLPPDNYQEEPIAVIAHRTSPTNIGFLLLAAVAAYDFGYIGLRGLAERLERTMETLHRLERHRGHFYNWYDTIAQLPLRPGYISTVDSGNLAASLLVVKQACLELVDAPVLAPAAWHGLQDTIAALAEALAHLASTRPAAAALCAQMSAIAGKLGDESHAVPAAVSAWLERLDEIDQASKALTAHRGTLGRQVDGPTGSEVWYWCEQLTQLAGEHRAVLQSLAPWALSTADLPLNAAASGRVPLLGDVASGRAGAAELPVSEQAVAQPRLAETKELHQRSQQEADQWRVRLQAIAQQAETLTEEMDFTFLFDPRREVFSVGLNLETNRLDNSYYDLLASEARLTSFLAIARGQAPLRHWFKLARPLAHVAGETMLLSWGGTMFEYLMPSLWMRTYERTLLHQTCQIAVRRQIEYGAQRRVPWGISESGYFAVDYQQNYQYRMFGVPDLGLKRDPGDNLVIAPYATYLALPFAPLAAWENLQRLAHLGAAGAYGNYEAIDFTAARRPKGERFGLVRSYMAHHQGMSLCALDNFLNGDAMQRRFSSEPMVSAAELLLQEKLPRHVPIIEPHPENGRGAPDPDQPAQVVTRPFSTPKTRTPRAHLLSNGAYTVMLTNAGGGYSAYYNMAVTRWNPDVTCDASGMFIYIMDMQSHETWSVAYQPTAQEPSQYEAVFTLDTVIFRRRDAGIETLTEIAVSAEDNIEVRRISLTNNTRQPRDLQITSFAEVVLDTADADAAHPAFSKLFVESEFLADRSALLFKRRPRAAGQSPNWAMHLLMGDDPPEGPVEYETDRGRFLGRGRTPRNPEALSHPLSNTAGAVLDPSMSLRRAVRLEPGEQATLAFVTGIAESREHALRLAAEYGDPRAVGRVFDMSAAHNQVRLRHLGISADDAHLFQRLASRVLYPDATLRAPAEVLARNDRGQASLYAYGISGDNPIVLVKVDDEAELPLVRQALLAHEFWRLHNLTVDLVILNTRETTYANAPQGAIQNMIDTSLSHPWVDKPGGIFVRRSDHMPEDDRLLLETVARVVLDGDAGTLADHLDRSGRLSPGATIADRPRPAVGGRQPVDRRRTSAPGPGSVFARPASVFFNGLGGFDPDQREYVIALEKGQVTPMPWINVLANENFGCLVSESALGYSWAVNSQLNRLTPWSNDPISDPPGEAIYLRDEASGASWSPTPLPIREDEPYVIRHGAGYTRFTHRSHDITQELLVFVPADEPLKVLQLKLRNESSQTRTLSVVSYSEWVLGVTRAQSQYFVVSEYDQALDALFARNNYNTDFKPRVAFVAAGSVSNGAVRPPGGFTADRTEFIGRNGGLQRPAGLGRVRLSGSVGAGLDPCAAMQVQVELRPQQDQEVVFLVGQGKDIAEARALIQKYRTPGQVQTAFGALKARWDELLGTLQVATPDAALDTLLNQWLLYQALVCRVWARAAFYQSGGAFGYRDQLQDVMALVWTAPDLTREHILRSAAHQFVEGDVLHWWHTPAEVGLRTHFSDDYLWLPYVTDHYVAATGDAAILDAQVPFLAAPPLQPDEHVRYFQPAHAAAPGTLYEHCVRALDLALGLFGAHGLPLMGSGDWNDGMNFVGAGGKGESVWVGWFLYANLVAFATLAAQRGDTAHDGQYRARAEQLKRALDEQAWDGEWYRRAYFDDGTPLGSAHNDECRIDSIAQSWAVISRAAPPARAAQALQAVEKYLIDGQNALMRLLAPPFDAGILEPGYIKGYVPGIRENGGQYTHAALWMVVAYAMQGDGERAVRSLALLNPINHALTPEAVARYKVEPYVVAADVYSHPQHVGRGGWTWYTGSAGWMYRVGVESVLGLKRRRQAEGRPPALVIEPCIPRDWKRYQLTLRLRRAGVYVISVENPDGVTGGVASVTVDGVEQAAREIPLLDDGQTRQVRVVLGKA
jgi:cyclic beta-1,2-glucan synthetase